MNFIQCNACPSHAECVEAGKCLNTLVTHRMGRLAATIAVAAPHTPAAPGSGSQPPSSTPRTAPAAPRGGQRTVIWDHMDAIWEQAGKPSSLNTVLVLRKRCMDELEQQGVKRTSASSELGNWWKARATQ